MKKKFLLLTFFEVVLIFLLAFNIIKKAVNENISINPIRKDTIAFSPTGELKHFYEPKADSSDPDLNASPLKAKYSINNDTLNDRYDYTPSKPERTFRIVTLGDSFTYGLYVDTKNNWTEILEDKLNNLKCLNYDKFEVINLGVHGYDTRYTVERFDRRGSKYNPDLVAWFFVDLLRIDERLIPLSTEYEKKLGDGKDYYLPWRNARQDILNGLGHEGIIAYQKSSLELFSKLYSGPLLIIPSWRITKNSPEGKLLEDYHSSRKYSYFLESLYTLPDRTLLFEEDPHPNEKGHEYIATKVYQFILKSQIFPCDKDMD